jgi:thiosulfate/3-mercaptopyruvate sulfurtransferase
MTSSSLIDVDTLAEHIGDLSLRIFDATVILERPPAGGPYTVRSGRELYEQEHIPGAAFADIPGDLSDEASPFAFTLPSAARFAAAAGRLGIGEGQHVVVYAQESPMWATRLWWLLRFFGFDAVSVLDGGLPAWHAAGQPTETGPASYPPTEFMPRPRRELLATRHDVEAIVAGHAPACLVNALAAAVFRGEGPSSYSRPGRIPNSVNLPWANLIDPETNRFRPVEELRDELEAVGALGGTKPVVAYCGGGISATVDLFALALAGEEDARLYDGSLTEWTRDAALPVETG